MLARAIRVDAQVLRFVLRERTLDPRLDGFARVLSSTRTTHELDLAPETWNALPDLGRQWSSAPLPRLYFEGPDLAGQRAVAKALAAEAGVPLLMIDLEQARQADASLADVMAVAFREAWFGGAALFLNGIDVLRDDAQTTARARLHAELAESRVLMMLAGAAPWLPEGETPTGVVTVPFPVPPAPARRAYWDGALSSAGIAVDAETLDALAGQYRLTADRISDAVLMVRHRSAWTGSTPQPADLFAAARAQSSQDLAASARKIIPMHNWDALILPEDAIDQLRELRDRVAHRQRVLGAWGFDQVLSLGKGVCALFAGPSGTGKTMAAEVLAGEMGLDLYKIDLATVVSKYIGETEKNLEAVFNAATSSNAVLFFDEADAIFGKRSDVHDAHDRYANLEIAYLLQKMEQYDGIAILATNLRQNLDDAFLRRLHVVIELPMPDTEHRARMWRQFLPAAAPVDPGIDYDFLARQFRLSGGNIKNIVVSAAYHAAANGGCITMPHLLRATWREHQKIGRRLPDTEIGEYLTVGSPSV
ncbi:MAG: ATP-binding protein [Chloroflexota bacterium]|nr:ATP-binding protein [Chloroflexota bacterium]